MATTAAEMEHVVNVERSSIQMLHMKESMADLSAQLRDTQAEQTVQRQVVKAVEDILTAIQEETVKATESDEPEMYSALVHDQPQMVEIEELKTRVCWPTCCSYTHIIFEKFTLLLLLISTIT